MSAEVDRHIVDYELQFEQLSSSIGIFGLPKSSENPLALAVEM